MVVMTGNCDYVTIMRLGNCVADATKRDLKVMYTNTDQFINNRGGLCLLICCNEPYVILLTEAIPKAQRLPMDLTLLHTNGFDTSAYPSLFTVHKLRAISTKAREEWQMWDMCVCIMPTKSDRSLP